MCLAIPMELVSRAGSEGSVSLGGVTRRISLALLPEAEIGDYVLVHAGYAIGRLDAEEARRTLAMLEDMTRTEDSGP